ncbi:4Fe-4S binding protein [candidate division KSB1 bacterium]
MKKIGVFVCHCGINIASTVDVKKVAEKIGKIQGVEVSMDYIYMCSEPGQNIVKDIIKEKKLDGVVVAACSPTLHEKTFRSACEQAGLNQYLCEIANIREQCSWVHKDKDPATKKAIKIIKNVVEKVRYNQSLEPISVPVTKRALVIGGGISGIQAALDIADSGYEVILVEREPSIGGHMIQLSETFPTLDCSQCILTPKMVDVGKHPNIELLTYSEIEEISGYVGNFNVKIKKKVSYVDWDKCTGCGVCIEKCPKKVPSEFDRNLGMRKAVYTPFPQAVPNKPVIDKENCIYFKTGKCKACEKFCSVNAIDWEQEEKFIEKEIGAVVVATGFDLYPILNLGEYGAGKIADVIDGLAFERLLSASGPTSGEIKRPSDGKVPEEIVFVQCSGSRDPELHLPYCSKVCCMYTTKHAMLYKHRVHDGQPYVFYIDVRTAGKGYEEFYQRATEEDDVVFLRGKVSKIFRDNGKVIVWGADLLSGKEVEIQADMVVLATAMVPSAGTEELVKKLKIACSADKFIAEAHPKLRPVESITGGFFLAGCCQAPKDIPEAVAQASGAASKVLNLFSHEEIHQEPIIAVVNEDLCSGCRICVPVCPYSAREFDEEKSIVTVNEVLCEGCGACVAACPSGATSQNNFFDEQIREMIKVTLED